jgi:hypothetical protein
MALIRSGALIVSGWRKGVRVVAKLSRPCWRPRSSLHQRDALQRSGTRVSVASPSASRARSFNRCEGWHENRKQRTGQRDV